MMKFRTRFSQLTALAAVGLAAVHVSPATARDRWTAEQAKTWYAGQPWQVGANYVPSNAINQIEMWQPATFDPKRIDQELGWAENMGMTTMRVFLHDLLWDQDPNGFARRIDTFLAIADKHHIKPLFVLFDSCWDPDPKLGPQHPPIPGVHNSGWVQSPGTAALQDPKQYPRLEAYVKGVVGRFANDKRILGWDVWNEPDNPAGQYPGQPKNKAELVAKLLPQVFAWARSADPVQPLTSGLWGRGTDWSHKDELNPVQAVQVAQSDFISFHDYGWPESMEARIEQLEHYGRPIICTEYMARGNGSTFDGSLPVGWRHDVGMINWGFVKGKEQTHLPWDSWQRPYVLQQPTIWFHDVLHEDGTPYRRAEVELIHRLSQTPPPGTAGGP
ncbi:cellulase family glycosylhydrolase [Stakelama saccharophila]|uniref:Cellulase family glycosylhydrolase n=1 Tax=Stakelama saccharophila TaxID=3075605 RepID=A0ABZ0B7Z8_9SPHN|nr:cellulase family glycosylhydrolase [Stakelama sp. W311]WNO53555.1 cellulase family glycosylhydrolase [Stakelama sp. W311]